MVSLLPPECLSRKARPATSSMTMRRVLSSTITSPKTPNTPPCPLPLPNRHVIGERDGLPSSPISSPVTFLAPSCSSLANRHGTEVRDGLRSCSPHCVYPLPIPRSIYTTHSNHVLCRSMLQSTACPPGSRPGRPAVPPCVCGLPAPTSCQPRKWIPMLAGSLAGEATDLPAFPPVPTTTLHARPLLGRPPASPSTRARTRSPAHPFPHVLTRQHSLSISSLPNRHAIRSRDGLPLKPNWTRQIT